MPEKQFLQLGFNDNEKEVYLAVLRTGKIAAHRVSSLTGINRTTVYSIAKKLSNLGLISEDKGQKISYLVAEPPEKLLTMLQKEEDAIKEKKEYASDLIAELSAIKSEKQYSVPRIKFVEEIDLSEYLFASFIKWQKSAASLENIWYGYQDDTFFQHYQNWIRWTWKQDNDVETYLFINDISPTEDVQQKYKKRRHIKKLPNATEFDSGLWVAGDYIIMIQTKNRPHYMIEIHDEVLARNQRALFKGLWDLVK